MTTNATCIANIRAYWAAKGHEIALMVDANGIHSRTLDGVPNLGVRRPDKASAVTFEIDRSEVRQRIEDGWYVFSDRVPVPDAPAEFVGGVMKPPPMYSQWRAWR